jgi:hypothetical protein
MAWNGMGEDAFRNTRVCHHDNETIPRVPFPCFVVVALVSFTLCLLVVKDTSKLKQSAQLHGLAANLITGWQLI